jgi:signal transduction histidine kinase
VIGDGLSPRLLWPVLAAVGVGAEAAGFGFGDPSAWVPDLLTGWVVGASGLVAWERRPRSLVGPLLVATGALWFVGDVGAAAAYAYRGPLLHATLTYPGGRPRGRPQTLAVAVAYLAAAVAPLWRSEPLAIALAAGFVAAAVGHRRGAIGRERRERTYAVRATAAVAGLIAPTAAFRLAFDTPSAGDLSLVVFEAALGVLAIALVRGLLREPWARTGATDLVVELGESRSGPLRDRLSRALGDPTLEIGFRAPDGDGYVDAAGRAMTLPPPGSSRRTTVLEHDERAAAVLVHDPALLDDPGLGAAIAEAADLAGSNARLQAEVRAQIVELQASRRRLLVAADEERRRLEQRLQQTAERRLTRLLPELERARRAADGDPERAARLRRVSEQVEQSLAEVRRLAAGLHPRELAAAGLAGALGALAGRSAVPVTLALDVPDRLPPEAERAAYFVCSEGLANVAKYAEASGARVTVGIAGGRLRVEVADDGGGGADPGAGTGLRGLADRAEALGGALTVDSPPGAGTRLVAELPLTSPS